MTLTLVPEPLAAPGYRFTFRGPNTGEECKGCPFQKLCFGLDPGRRYQVATLRDVVHPCALHESGRVRVVTVEEVPFPTTLESNLLRGTAATWSPIPCGMPECRNYALCHPQGVQAATRHEIVASEGKVECPAGYDITRVQLKRMA